jgi:rsbT antagonist protein RsbS
MRVPILKQGDYVIASIQSALTDDDLIKLRDDLAAHVGRYRSKGVIVDVTVLDVMDSFATRTVRDLAQMVRLRGAQTVIVGIQPEVAFAMVQLGLELGDVATALDLVSEVARNILEYAKRGEVVVSVVQRGDRRGLEVLARDRGPGIADVSRAMQDGFSTSRGLGLGLPGSRRLMDDFELESKVGLGTTVTMRKWLP